MCAGKGVDDAVKSQAAEWGVRVGRVGGVNGDLNPGFFGNGHEVFIDDAEVFPPVLQGFVIGCFGHGIGQCLTFAAREISAAVFRPVAKHEFVKGVAPESLSGNGDACFAKYAQCCTCIFEFFFAAGLIGHKFFRDIRQADAVDRQAPGLDFFLYF